MENIKKFVILWHPMGILSESDIFYKEPEGYEEEDCVYDSFEGAKEALLYCLNETAIEEEDEEIKLEILEGIEILKQMDETQYRQEYPENFN